MFRTIYVNVDSPNLGFPYFNFLGEAQCKKTPCIWVCTVPQILQLVPTGCSQTGSNFIPHCSNLFELSCTPRPEGFPEGKVWGKSRGSEGSEDKSWQVLSRYNETRWSCGGILITPRVVLTAAHCQGKTPGTKIQVAAEKDPSPSSTFDILCSECPARRMEGCRAGPRNGTCWFRVLNKCWWIFSLQFIIRPTTFRVLICSFQWEAAPWAKLWDWPQRCHCSWGEYFPCNTNQLRSCFVDTIFRNMGLWSRTIGGTLWTTLR